MASASLRAFLSKFQPMLVGPAARGSASPEGCQPAEFWFGYDPLQKVNISLFVVGCASKPNVRMTVPDDTAAPVTFELDRNGDEVPDAQLISNSHDTRIATSFWDDKFDGHFDLKGEHDRNGDPTPLRKLTKLPTTRP